MKKRIFLLLALAALAGGGVFAQTDFASVEYIAAGGIGGRYEYVITPYITVGGYVSFNYMPTPYLDEEFSKHHTIFGAGLAVRWYPTGRQFFAGLDWGYGLFTNAWEKYYRYQNGTYDHWHESDSDSAFTIAPGFGWTIDVGRAGGFFISPGAKVPFFFTGGSDDSMGLGKGVLLSGIIYFGVGWAF
jgi:hypothetical protein